MKNPVSILSIASISALGTDPEEIWQNYTSQKNFFTSRKVQNKEIFGAFLSQDLKASLEELKESHAKYRQLDASVLYAMLSARLAVERTPKIEVKDLAINIGSSRGATALFEKYHAEFMQTGKTPVTTSPSTTLGNISSWVAQDLQSEGPQFSHSVTCSTAMHAILNGIAWLQSGMATQFLAGGSEAALTPFSIAQMKAMKIYGLKDGKYPNRALDMKKEKNSMILGEAAGMVVLQNGKSENARAFITGIGYANEQLKHGASISSEGTCLQKSMKMAIGDSKPSEVDVVVSHTPGTLGGDLAEINAIKAVFGKEMPSITTNKWQIGHTFAASGILSLEMAMLMLKNQEFLNVPFSEFQKKPRKLEKILVNAVGFGGNAVSLLISRNL